MLSLTSMLVPLQAISGYGRPCYQEHLFLWTKWLFFTGCRIRSSIRNTWSCTIQRIKLNLIICSSIMLWMRRRQKQLDAAAMSTHWRITWQQTEYHTSWTILRANWNFNLFEGGATLAQEQELDVLEAQSCIQRNIKKQKVDCKN